MLKKTFKTIGITLLVLLLCFSFYLFVSGKTYVYKALIYNFANVDDYQLFENRLIHKSSKPQPWPLSTTYNKKPLNDKLQKTLDSLQTFAFLVVKNDSMVFESYSDGYGANSYSNSFSMAKAVTSVLVGAAIKDGKIKSVDQPVGDFLEHFRNNGLEKVTIKHLLTMSSGLNWDESYANPLSMTTEAYYGSNLPALVEKLAPIEDPGKQWKYLSGNTQVLAMVLEKATGKRLAEYAEEKLWQPLGMENDALWCLDKKDGMEKAYCCLNSNARDFAKIGKLYLQKGNWNGTQLVDSSYVDASLSPINIPNAKDQQSVDFYGYQWWLILDYQGGKVFYARGILGQYIIVLPEKNIIIVRLGKQRGAKRGEQQSDVYTYLEEVEKTF
jgi:CubicO group peptidase (beta-lactamase class C family)